MYHQRVDTVAAFVLAGGKSVRMGKDKAFLELAGKNLLMRALEVVSAVTSEVWIVGNPEKFMPFGRVVEDIYAERGPLGGIQAALLRSPIELNVMLAVDLPFVEANLLAYLVSAASQNTAMVTVPKAAGRLQPLCAVYRKEFGKVAEQALRKGKNKIEALFTQVETREIGEQELTRMGFSAGMLRNVNTPEEFKQADKMFEARGDAQAS